MTYTVAHCTRSRKNIVSAWRILWTVALLFAACDSDSVTGLEPSGTLKVTVITTGQTVDPDGYQIHFARNPGNVNFPDERLHLAVNGARSFAALQPGAYLLRLDNVADNCVVQTDNPLLGPTFREAVVQRGREGTAHFDVRCVAP